MRIIKHAMENDLMTQGCRIYVDIATLDSNDNPVQIALSVLVDGNGSFQHNVSPGYLGIKYTKEQVRDIINRIYPSLIKSVSVDNVPVQIEDDFDELTHDEIVGEIIHLVHEHTVMKWNKEIDNISASIINKDRLVNGIKNLIK